MHPPTTRPTVSGLIGLRALRAVHGPRLIALACVIACVIACGGCGPFGYLKKVATDATRAVADAEAAGAEEYAPYEYWGAVAYLEQSKILMGYSEYERSFDFGERSKQLANEAKIKAQRVKKGESVVHDETIAAPSDMIDSEGKQIDSIDEVERDDAGEKKDGSNTDGINDGGKGS